MYIISFEDFKEKCINGFCLRKSFKSKNCEKDYKIKKCYTKYLEQIEKNKEFKLDEKWEEVKRIVDIRDKFECQLISKLSSETLKLFYKHSHPGLIKILDHAHVIGRGEDVRFKYNPDGIVLLNRFSHSMLDQMKSPITGKPISKEEHDYWWKFIVGEERYKKLIELKKEFK